MNLIVTTNQIIRSLRLILVLVLVVNFSYFLEAQQRYDLDYQVFTPEGLIPNDYLNIIKGESKINFHNSSYLSKEQKAHFRNATNYSLKEIFTNGDIYINDPMTDYVRKVADSLLEDSPLRGKIRLYVGKSTTVNATSWQDGTIIINIGLLSRLKNEDQLAFVIAHELSHIMLQHPYLQYANYIKSGYAKHDHEHEHDHSLAEGFNATDYVLRHELTADSIALSFMYGAGYDGEEAIFALEVLLYKEQRNLPDLVEYFSSPNFLIENTQLCESREYTAFMQTSINPANKHFSDANLETRLGRIRSQIAERNSTFAFNVPKGGFTNVLYRPIGQMASFENVNQAFEEGNHLLSMYEALILMERYPDNKFLHIKVSENLHYINSYNNLGSLNKIFLNAQHIDESNYAKFCCFINKLAKEDLRRSTYEFIMNMHESYPKDERMLFITAQTVANYKGKKAAISFYKDYLRYFPNGKHSTEIKRILE